MALLIPSLLVLMAIWYLGRKDIKTSKAGSVGNSHSHLAVVAVTPFLLFLALFKPDLGLTRDWDIFAPLTPFLVLAFLPALERTHDKIQSWIVPVIFLGVLQTTAWIAINASSERSEARYKESLLRDRSHVGYGYEVLAEHYKRWQRDEEVLEALRSAHKADGNPRYAFSAGVMAAELGLLDEAISMMRLCLRSDPANTKASANLASYLVEKRDFKGVIEVTTQGLEFEPDDVYLNVFLGMALFETRQYETAYIQLRRSLELDLTPEMKNDVTRAVALIEQAMSSD